MKTKFSEDIVTVSDLKMNPGRIIRQVQEAHRPVVLSSRGRGVAVVQSLSDFEAESDERAFMRGVLKFDLKYWQELIRPPFRIVYRQDVDRIRIVRVWRSERLLILL